MDAPELNRRLMLSAALGAFSTALLSPALVLAARKNLKEFVRGELSRDKALSAKERDAMVDALNTALAAYMQDTLGGNKKAGAETLLSIVAEGSMEQLPPKRIAEVAAAAYKAVRRGSPPDVVEGIALYGFSKRINPDKLAGWANGYREMTKNRVPAVVAADAIKNAKELGWSLGDFNKVKWGLVNGVKKGHDPKLFAHWMLGTLQKKGKRPGAVSSEAMTYFNRLKGKAPKLPAYEPIWAPKPDPAQKRVPPKTKAPPEAKPQKTAPKLKPKTTKAPQSKKPVSLGAMWGQIDTSIQSFLGTPYVWGGESRSGCDCSGFVQTVFGEAGVDLPRVSRQQWKTGRAVPYEGLRPGDLVFFNTRGTGVTHVGICVDSDGPKFAHASSSRGVVVDKLSKRYYKKRYLGARRVA